MRGARLSRIRLISPDLGRIAAFYRSALGFADAGDARDGESGRLLTLGREAIEIITPNPIGAVYPPGIDGASPLFQHFAIVVSDMHEAYAHLCAQGGWVPISQGGPQKLPASSGGVIAFKFRDPDGHPLELIEFPGGSSSVWPKVASAIFLGIDHSALSVADTARSAKFYADLGFERRGGSSNHGREQSQLDGMMDAEVDVTSLAAYPEPPHVELLCYGQRKRDDRPAEINDVAATQLVFSVADPSSLATAARNAAHVIFTNARHTVLRDPDGHLIRLEAASHPPVAKPG